ncbi:PilZ domain-containing protein [Robbsia sp. Bb-Pol-6]|uniref:PilZ domain-containing protein n=1 Tax=Robbsia betulipollinis TaxID=2981849 RepID=A0ABT3ZS57_9BURK|nr:PilZ domain-containing protein [Robbsia betulipollinis]MCY0389398.1 PilZ domain-containing protein [Robbsia betulipollinis]
MFDVDQRNTPRRTLRVQATLTGRDGSQLVVRTFDVSVGGVCILTEQPLPLKEPCSVTFQVYANGVRSTFNGDGRIVYCMLASTHFKSGIQFDALTPASRGIIEGFLAAAHW